MNEKIESITWQEFQKRKNQNRIEILEYASSRVEEGHRSHYNLDLDMLPVINRWDKLPFSFTIQSCSGTPTEHGREEYGHVNGHSDNPNAMLFAHSYMAHPLFPFFKDHLEYVLNGEADITESGPFTSEDCLEEFGGIYLHAININVPEEIKQSDDLKYLDRFWENLKKGLDEFVRTHNYEQGWDEPSS